MVPLYAIEWPRAIAISSATTFVDVVSIGIGFLVGGMLAGMRVIFVGLLSLLVGNIVMLEFIVFTMPAMLALSFGLGAQPHATPRQRQRSHFVRRPLTHGAPSVTYTALVVVLMLGLYFDNGAGLLYGSGIEVFGFVLLPLLEGYIVGIVIYATSTISAYTAHTAGGLVGALLLFCPTLCRAFGDSDNMRSNTRRGFHIAALLQFQALLSILLLFFACGVTLPSAVQERPRQMRHSDVMLCSSTRADGR